MTLIQILMNLEPTDDFMLAIYSGKVGGVFTPESPARIGQRQFEGGGMLDGKVYFDHLEHISSSLLGYAYGELENREHWNQEWAKNLIEEVNELEKELGT